MAVNILLHSSSWHRLCYAKYKNRVTVERDAFIVSRIMEIDSYPRYYRA
jgi:hypothetical protein